MTRILIALLLLLGAIPALADKPPLSQRALGDSAKVGKLCSAFVGTTGGCTTTSGSLIDYTSIGGTASTSNIIVADFRGYSSVAFYSNQSASATYTCDVYSSDNGYDADSGDGQDRSTTALSNTQTLIVLDGSLAFTWIECSSNDVSVTITFTATK